MYESPHMLYATQLDNLIVVGSASNLIDFETFCAEAEDGEGFTMERADILDMLGMPILRGYTSAPMKIECNDSDAAARAIAKFDITLLRPQEAVDMQEAMVERAKMEMAATQPPDRRTLAEVHGIEDNDPWDKSTDEQKEAARKQNEHMKSVRDAGGLTNDSFAGATGEKLNVHRTTVQVNQNDEVTGVDMVASKNTIRPYELVVDGEEAVDWKTIFDEIKLPENRILAEDGNRVIIKLHDFQTAEVAAVFDRMKRSYTLNKQLETIDEEETETMEIEGHEDVHIFYSVQIDQATIHEMVPLLGSVGFDTVQAATMRNVGRGCWFAFTRERIAKECADLVRENGHACAVVAINRTGQPIVSGGDQSIRVVDTNEEVDIGPRPWNDRAGEIAGMSDEEKTELAKSVQGSEFLIAIEENERHRTICYIVPESYFREHDKLFDGDLMLDIIPKDAGRDILKQISPGVYSSFLEAKLLKDNLCRWGFIESMLLRIHLNDLLSEQRVTQ